MDLNMDKPAYKHQGGQEISRRDFIKNGLKKGALLGLAGALGVEGYKLLTKNNEKREDNPPAFEDKELDILNEKLNSAEQDIEIMKNKLAKYEGEETEFIVKIRKEISEWENELALYRTESKETKELGRIIVEAEEFEKNISTNKLRLEYVL